jgi:RNA polymerase sigma factor (sigma-70 family)
VGEDALLIRQLRRGDRAALHRIYEQYKDDLLTIAGCLLVDRAAAEDCLHDVFVGFAAGIAKLRLRSNLKGFLAVCMANRARDQLRRRPRQVPLADVGDIVAAGPDPPTQVINCEETARLYAALAELPYEQREVIALRLRGQLRFREIARHQGVSTNTVQSRYRYGLDKLRTLLKQEHEHEARA